jgi:hypothetical protein
MNRTRSLAAALALPLVAAGVLVVGSSQTAAAQRHDVAAPTQRVAAGPLIQGVVVSTAGRYLDNVDVRAVSDGHNAASSLTYASSRADGPQHGYFYLSVPRGTYDVVLSRSGYESRTISDVSVTRSHRKISLGEITLKAKPAPTSTGASLKSSKVTTADKARLTVRVSSKATSKPVGDVTVMIGRQEVGSDTLTAADGGSVTIGLKRQDVGTYKVKAYFDGSKKQNLAASSSGPVTLQVTRAKHHRPTAG